MFKASSTIRFRALLMFSGNFVNQILHPSAFLETSSTIRFCSTSRFYATWTIKFGVLQRFSDFQPSDFEQFNVLCETSTIRFWVLQGFMHTSNHQILRTSMFYATSTIRFCVLQRFSESSTIRFWALHCFRQSSTIRFCILQCFMRLQPSDFAYFKVLGDFNIRFCVLQGFRRLQPSDFAVLQCFKRTSTIRFCIVLCFL